MAITGTNSLHRDERFVVEELSTDADVNVGANLNVAGTGTVTGNLWVTKDFAVGTKTNPHSFLISLAASTTTDGMDISIKPSSSDGVGISGVHVFDFYMSETNSGSGITADAYSGDLTATQGAILVALVAKKMWRVSTNAGGEFAGTLVASANPVDQYVTVIHPMSGQLVVSAASGTNWEGAA